MNPSDQELICQLLSKEAAIAENAWQYVYKAYFPMARNMILKHNGSKQDAVDIFQDSLVIFNHNLRNGSFKEHASVKTYIFGICKNLWFKEYAKKQRQLSVGTELLQSSYNDVEYLINIEIVGLLINELEEDCKRIIIEFYYNHKSIAQLKEFFNVNSIQALKNKKWRCMKCLIKLFKEKGVVPTWTSNK